MQERVSFFVIQKVSTIVSTICHGLIKSRQVVRIKVNAITALLVVVFLLVSLVPAQAIIIAPTLDVFGVVTDGSSGEPLAGISVSITGPADHYDVITDENGLYQSDFILCDGNPTSVNVSIEEDGYENYLQSLAAPCYFSYEQNIVLQPASDEPEPVILVPGIMGSWNANLLNGIPWADDEWVMDPILHTYDQLVNNLVLYGGYVVGETLFPFPYDWRITNITTAAFLRDKINEVKALTGANKVDIVAHSMGGLITRYYVESSLYQDDVDQVIFIATPHRGSPKAYLAWEGGYTGVTVDTDFIKESLLKQVAIVSDYDSVFDYVRNYPISTVQELLPDYEYLIDKSSGQFIPYSETTTDYPQNELLHFLNQPENIDLFLNRVGETSIIYNSDSGNTPVSFEIVSPLQEQLPKWEHGYPDGFGRFDRKEGVNLDGGDTTVPSFSSTGIFVDRFVEKIGAGHMSIVDYSSTNVLDILQGVYVPITVVDEPTEYNIIQIYSPLDIQIVSPSGKKIGSNFIGGELNEISGSYYSGLGASAEFVVIPDPEIGKYRIMTQGTGQGEFRIDASYVNDEGIDTKSVSGTTDLGELIDFSFSSQQGVIDLLPDDQAAPIISINSPIDKQYLHSDLINIDYEVTDGGTGVSQQTAYLNGEETTDSQFDLFNFSLGEHQFKVQAYDMVNNQAEEVVVFEVIANFDSLRTDINRLFDEGEIKDSKTTKHLLKQVDNLEKWYNKITKFKDKDKDKDKLKGEHNYKDDDKNDDKDWDEDKNEDRGEYGDEHHDQSERNLMDKLLAKLVDKYLNKLEKKGKISAKANSMLAEQITYIINHL